MALTNLALALISAVFVFGITVGLVLYKYLL